MAGYQNPRMPIFFKRYPGGGEVPEGPTWVNLPFLLEGKAYIQEIAVCCDSNTLEVSFSGVGDEVHALLNMGECETWNRGFNGIFLRGVGAAAAARITVK